MHASPATAHTYTQPYIYIHTHTHTLQASPLPGADSGTGDGIVLSRSASMAETFASIFAPLRRQQVCELSMLFL